MRFGVEAIGAGIVPCLKETIALVFELTSLRLRRHRDLRIRLDRTRRGEAQRKMRGV